MKAWYFSDSSKRLKYGDGRKIKIGRTHKVEGNPECCVHGLHGSIKILDALSCANGTIIYRVDISGDIDKRTDKICGKERTYLAGGIDIAPTLREFARWCALQCIHLWNAPDVVVKYLKTGDESLREAAGYAVEEAFEESLVKIAGKHALHAAYPVVWIVANTDADIAAWQAAWNSSYYIPFVKQNRKLTSMVNKLLK